MDFGNGAISGFQGAAKGLQSMVDAITASQTVANLKSMYKFNTLANLKLNAANNQFNLDLAREQNEFNYKMWEENNAYNSPSKQIERLKEAGLSSAAAAQNLEGAGNSSAPVQSANLANQVAGHIDPMDYNPVAAMTSRILQSVDLVGLMRSIASFRKENAEADKVETETKYAPESILTNNDAKRAQAALTWQQITQAAESFPYSLQGIKYKTDALRYDSDIAYYTKECQRMNFKLAEQKFGFLEQKNSKEIEELGERIKNIIEEGNRIRQDIKESKSRESVNYASAENIQEDTSNKKILGEGYKLDNVKKEIDNTLANFGFPTDPAQKIGALLTSGKLKAEDLSSFLENSRTYITSSGRVFNGGNQGERQYFMYVLNPGQGEANKTPVWSHGSIYESADLLNRFGEGFVDDFKNGLRGPWYKP